MSSQGQPTWPGLPAPSLGRVLFSEFSGSPLRASTHRYEARAWCRDFGSGCPLFILEDTCRFPAPSKPFKVIFRWLAPDPPREAHPARAGLLCVDEDRHQILEVLQEHVTLSSAQKGMQRLAREMQKRLPEEPAAAAPGDLCRNTLTPEGLPCRVGDLVQHTTLPSATVWRVTGEKKFGPTGGWLLVIEHVVTLLGKAPSSPRSLDARQCMHQVLPVGLIDLGKAYLDLGNLMRDEAKRTT